MIIGFISDIHGNVYGLQAALNALKIFEPEFIVCAGDVVGYYPFVNETIELLRREQIACVMGNHDAMLVGQLRTDARQRRQYALDYASSIVTSDNIQWLRQLPISLFYELDGLQIEVFHGSPWSPLVEYIYPDHNNFERFREINRDFVILGHTHWPLLQAVGTVNVVNPGSCGQPRDYKPGACYALLDTRSRHVILNRVSYNMQPLAEKGRQLKLDRKIIDILYRTRSEHGREIT